MDSQPRLSATTRLFRKMFLFGLVMAFVFFIAACAAATDRPQPNSKATVPTQEQPAASATMTRTPTQPATRTATPQPTDTPTTTPSPSVTPTLTPVSIPFDAISDGNAGKIKPMLMLSLEEDEHPFQMAFSQDGGTLTIVSQIRAMFKDPEDAVVSVRNAGTGEVLQQVKMPYGGYLHPDGLHFIAYDESKLYLYDLLSGQVTSEQVVAGLDKSKLILSPDGSYLVISRSDQAPEIWDLKQGASVFKPADITYTHDMAFSPDGSTLAILVFYDVFLYNLKTGALVNTFSIHPRATYDRFIVGDIAISPDGTQIAVSCSFDTYPAFVLWDARSAEQLAVWNTRGAKSGPRSQVVFSPDGKWVATSALDKVFLFNGKTGALWRTFTGTLPLAFSPDSRFLTGATEQGNIQLWSLEKGSLLVSLRGHTQKVDQVLFHPNGKLLASRQYDASVGLWGVPSAGMTIARAGISIANGVSSLSESVPKAWRAGGGKPARYHIDITLSSATLKSCPYTGNHTLLLKQRNENVAIIDLETNTVIARHTFQGQTESNSRGCPMERTFQKATEEVFVTIPDYEGFSKWLETTMAPYGFVP